MAELPTDIMFYYNQQQFRIFKIENFQLEKKNSKEIIFFGYMEDCTEKKKLPVFWK